MNKIKIKKREKRRKKIRAKVRGTSQKPRLAVFKSNLHIYGQIIDDDLGKTLISASDLEMKKSDKSVKKQEIAFMVGEKLSQKAVKKKNKQVVFDRGGFKFHGRIKAFAQGSRKAGLKFQINRGKCRGRYG